MNIIPKLTIKDNLRIVDNNSIVNAVNMNVSDDGLLQTEYNIIKNDIIINAINEKFNNISYKIIHCIECSEELIIFVKQDNINYLTLFRYNEKENKCIFVIDNFIYSGGKLISTFTYNKNNLIVVISEYFDDNTNKIPLKVLNLGEFKEEDFLHKNDLNQLEKSDLHTLLPAVKIPNVDTNIITGNSIKGWYYIFIRYKISNDTYTQWFNTNQSIFLDSFSKENILDYSAIDNNDYFTSTAYTNISNDKDIVSNSFIMNFHNLDINYKEYQIGIILLNKEISKAYYSGDLDININSVKFNKFLNYTLTDIVTKYNNYYNVKVLESYNNKLYIGNYEELFDDIDVSNIKLEISANKTRIADISNNNVTYLQDCVKYNPQSAIYKYEDIRKELNQNVIDTDILFNKDKFIYKGKQFDGVIGSLVIKDNAGNKYLASKDNYKNVLILCSLYRYDNGTYNNYVYAFNTTLDKCVILNDENNANLNSTALNLAILDNDKDKTVYKPWEIKFTESNLIPDADLYNKTNFKFNIFIDERLNDFQEHYEKSFFNGIHENPFNKDIEDKTFNDIFDINKNEILWEEITSIEEEMPLDDLNINTKQYVLNPNTNPYEWYSFYIHFVNKYGETTRGIPINNFKLNIINENLFIENDNIVPLDETFKKIEFNEDLIIYSVINQLDLKLLSLTNIKSNDDSYKFNLLSDNIINNFSYNFYFKLENIPNEFIGYFVSYEKIEKTIVHHGFAQYKTEDNKSYINLFNNKLNYKDAIDFNFNKIVLNKLNNITLKDFEVSELNAEIQIKQTNLDLNNYIEEVIDKQLIIAEESFSDKSDNNTRIKINPTNKHNILNTDNNYFCLLINDDITSKYINSIKELIPCSNIIYDINSKIKINIKNAFITKNVILYYKQSLIYNNAENKFMGTNSDKVIKLPYYPITYIFYDDILNETVQFKNKPKVLAVPIYIDKDDSSKNKYNKNKIVEYKDNIDLFVEKNVSYYESYPIVLNYKYDNINNNRFYNSIRRSEPILDESNENNWRKFNTNLYKNLPENKGEVVKLINTGNNILIHTKNSLFILDGNDSIKTYNDGKIQLAAVDIWDINYKELTPSILGYGGLNKSKHSIAGNFGYIWYNDNKIFMLSGNNQFKLLSEDISSLIGNGETKYIIENLFEDVTNSRIIFKFNNCYLTFSYKTNTFISFLNYLSDSNIYNTKNKTYLFNYRTNDCYNYDLTKSINRPSSISIIFNENYDYLKVIESVCYSLNKKVNINNLSINDLYKKYINEKNYYAGTSINIISDFCSTEDIDITLSENEVNNINPNKPYYNMGLWIFNNIRNNLQDYNYGQIIHDESSLIYGKYFILTLILDKEDVYQLNSIDFNVSKV